MAIRKKKKDAAPVQQLNAADLNALVQGRLAFDEVEKEYKAQKKLLEGQEKVILAQVKAGFVAPEGFTVQVDVEETGVRPKWKEEFGKVCVEFGRVAEVEYAKVTAATPAGTREVLVVTGQPNVNLVGALTQSLAATKKKGEE